MSETDGQQTLVSGGGVRPRSVLSLRARALQLLARREHSRLELKRKLSDHSESESDLDALLDDLEAKGWLSDLRATESLVHRLAPRKGGRSIQMALQRMGIEAPLQAEALLALRASERERAEALWSRKFSQPRTAQERARQLRFLMARGFVSEVAHAVVPRAVQREAAGPEWEEGPPPLDE